jgi:Asp-tRNA(Asn)/Glu-tRNA(Gln) amidotransferase A subunit family amidase
MCLDLRLMQVQQLKAARNEYRYAYNDLWQATGAEDGHVVDAILCPVGPGAAPPHGHAKYWSYTSQWNMLDYPAIAFPVTKVDQTLDQKEEGYKPLNADDQWNQDLYDPQKYVDAPVGLQLVTRHYEDEKCLAVLSRIEQAMGRQ